MLTAVSTRTVGTIAKCSTPIRMNTAAITAVLPALRLGPYAEQISAGRKRHRNEQPDRRGGGAFQHDARRRRSAPSAVRERERDRDQARAEDQPDPGSGCAGCPAQPMAEHHR